jgi:cobalt-zinc-cadmium efflux system membrane fusion protein
MTVADLAKVWVMLEVPQSEASRIQLGSAVAFHSEVAPGEKFVGTVTRLGESYDPQSRTVQVRTEIHNNRRLLKPGMLVLATAAGVSRGHAMPAVPLSALQTIDGKDYVFVALPDHRFEKRLVSCTDRSAQTAWVAKGVKSGESVVTNGSFFLKTEIVRSTIGGGA